MHKHKCPKCGFVWEHSDHCAGNKAAHTCPCGGESWWHFSGGTIAVFIARTCEAPRRVIKRLRNALGQFTSY